MDPELSKKYAAIEAKKQNTRTEAQNRFVKRRLPFLLALLAIGYAYSELDIAAVLAFLIGALWSTNILFPLSDIDRAFRQAYMAIQYLEENPADPLVQQRAYQLLASSHSNLRTEKSWDALLGEPTSLVKKTLQEVKTRLLPAVQDGKAELNTLEAYARIMASPSMSGVQELLTNINENKYTTREPSDITLRKRIAVIRSTRLGQIVEGTLYGFGVVSLGFFGVSWWVGQEFAVFISNNAGIFLLAGFGFSGAVLASLKKS